MTANNKFTGLWVRGEVQRCVATCILQVEINTELHEALEHFDLGVSGSLMDAVIAINVLHQRIHLLLHQDPDDLMVAMVTGPVHGRGATKFGWVGHRLKVVLLFVIV